MTREVTGYNIIVSLTSRKDNFFSYEDLLKEANRLGINKEALDKYLEKLKSLGTIYSPRPGVFRFAD